MSSTQATETRYRICPLCEACCGLDVQVADGQVVAIRGRADDVFSHGYICPKGYALKDLHEDPDRLRQPLVRRDGKLQPASWDDAFGEIERRLVPVIEQYGADAVALSVGNPAAHKMALLLYFARLARALGSKNVYSASTLDQMPKQLSSGWMFGHWLSVAVPDIERCDFLLILGANPMASNGSLWTVTDYRGKAKALRARGGQIVVVDPRRSETAAVADAHHFIRPGADVFLLAAMVNTVFAEGLARPGRLAEWTAGIDAVREAVAAFTPEAVAARCGIAAETIRGLARRLATTERACVYGRIGTCTQEFGTLSSWLVDVLNVLTGHLDAPGGAMFPKAAAFAANTLGKPGLGRGIVTGRHASRVSGAPEVMGELPMTLLAEEIETPGKGQIKALITVASNPVLSSPGGPRLAKALDSLEFMVSLDIYLNETSRHADVVLPGVSPLQDPHYDVTFPQLSHRNHARFSPPVFAPDAGEPTEWENLLRLLAVVRGQGARADVLALDDELLAQEVGKQAGAHAPAVLAALGASGRRGPERLLDLALRSGPYGDRFGLEPDGLNLDKVMAAPNGIDLGPLEPRIPEMLRTPSGRIELAPPACLADMARARERLAEPAPELVIVGRREVRSNNSWMHNLPTLAKGPQRCTVIVHPADAQRLGLADGAPARISARRANGDAARAVTAPVAVSAEMMPGVVSLPHGWGHDLAGAQLHVAAERPGANLNAVLDEHLRDPLSGNAVLSGVEVVLAPL
ncbi:molybdopterin-dependent oxidoreductase [Ideonella sp.]|uniref:molybdopterin-dependent oxidoreductase n=1 Tax=Ideonella sp. TaxID=1929293 RepID=UPI002B48F6F5|nr:molybdopterin-dependent oxidoreductase [Ideonella sp.]HJV69977.1 molybdopterin-dependent oxidoreductase [Ideonella sp.]